MSFIIRSALAYRSTDTSDTLSFWFPVFCSRSLYCGLSPCIIDEVSAALSNGVFDDYSIPCRYGNFLSCICNPLLLAPTIFGFVDRDSIAGLPLPRRKSARHGVSNIASNVPSINPSLSFVTHLRFDLSIVRNNLVTDQCAFLGHILILFPRLESLQLGVKADNLRQALLIVKGKCPRLTRLQLDLCSCEKANHENFKSVAELFDLLPTHLRDLHLPCSNVVDSNAATDMAILFAQLNANNNQEDGTRNRNDDSSNNNFARFLLQSEALGFTGNQLPLRFLIHPTHSKLRSFSHRMGTGVHALSTIFSLLGDRCPLLERLSVTSAFQDDVDFEELSPRFTLVEVPSEYVASPSSPTIICTRKIHEAFLHFTDNCPYLSALLLHPNGSSSSSAFDSTCLQILAASPCAHRSLKVLSVPQSNRICKTGVVAIALNCPHLERLNVANINATESRIDDEVLIALGRHCKNLKVLHIGYSQAFRGVGGNNNNNTADDDAHTDDSKTTHHEVTSAGLIALANGCKQLESFSISANESIDDSGVVAIAENCPNIFDLSLMATVNITDASLLAIAEHLPKMRMLSITQNSHVSDVGVIALGEKLKCLRFSDLSGTDKKKLTKAGLIVIHKQLGWNYDDD